MPSEPSLVYNDGAFERFLTSAICTILTLIFSWQIIIDMEHHAASKKRRIQDGKGHDTPSYGEYRNDKHAKSDDVKRNGFNDVALIANAGQKDETKNASFEENVFESEQKVTEDIFDSSGSNTLLKCDAYCFGDRSLSDGEVEFLKSVEHDNELAFDEEISLIPAQVPLIRVTPPVGGAKRPLEPYQTYFGSDSDSDVDGDVIYDASKLSPLDDFYMDYEDSSPSGSDNEVFCRHVLEAISEEDEDECESSSGSEAEDSEEEDDYRENYRAKGSPGENGGNIRTVSGRWPGVPKNRHMMPNRSPFRDLSLNKVQTNDASAANAGPAGEVQKKLINNSEFRYNECEKNAPRATEEVVVVDGLIHMNQCGPNEKQCFITDFSQSIHRNSPTDDLSQPDQKSLNNNLHLGCHSDISYIDADPDENMSRQFCGTHKPRATRPNNFDTDLQVAEVGYNESTGGEPSPFTNCRGHEDAEVSNSSPGGSTDNANLSIGSNGVLVCSGSTHTTLHSPVHVDRLLACAESQGLNTIQPSPSSTDHTGIISRNYYLDFKKPSMSRIRGQGVGDRDELNSPPFLSGKLTDGVYKDSILSDGTQDTPRGFTFVRCTDYEEDYKVTSTLLFQPRDPGVRLNVCKPGFEEEPHQPRVIEVDVHDIGAILSDTEKAKAELLGDTETKSQNVWDDLGKFDEVTPERCDTIEATPLSFQIYDKNDTADANSKDSDPQPNVFEPVIPEFKAALHRPLSDNEAESDNESSSTTTGDTAIEVISPKLSVVRIGSVDSNGTDEDFVAEILDENTGNMEDERSLNRVKKPEKDVNEEEPVFVNLAETVHSPKFKTRRKFQTRGDSGQSNSGHNARIVTNRTDNSKTALKNAYNRAGKYTPGSGMQILGVIDREDDHNHTSSGEESGSNSDSSGSFDCGDGEKSPRGSSERSVPKPKLEALGEIEEEISSDSSSEDSVKVRRQSGDKSDTSSTSSDSESSSESSEYEDAEESSLFESSSPVGNSSNIPAAQRSGPEDTVNRPLDAPYGSNTIGPEKASRPRYINEPFAEDTKPLPSRAGHGLQSQKDQVDYATRPHGTAVSTSTFDTTASSSPVGASLRPKQPQDTPEHQPGPGPSNSKDSTAPDFTEDQGGEADDMYSLDRRRSSGGKYSVDSDELVAYGRRSSYGKGSYVSPLASYVPPAPPKPEPQVPEYTTTGVQTLRSYRQPNACTFCPERYFRPSEVDSLSFTTMVEHHGTNVVEEHEYSEKGVQITFDPLWDREEASLVPSQEELSDECNKSTDSLDSSAYFRPAVAPTSPPGIPGDQSSIHPDSTVAGKSKSTSTSSSSSSSSSEGEFDHFEKEIEITAGQAKPVNTAINVGASFKAPISLEEDFDCEIAPEARSSPREMKLSPRDKVRISPREEARKSPREEAKLSPREVKVSPRQEYTKPPSPRGQSMQRPRTPPMVVDSRKKTPSVSVDIDIGVEEPLVAAEVKGVEMAPPPGRGFSLDREDDADDEESEAEDKPGRSLYTKFSKPEPKVKDDTKVKAETKVKDEAKVKDEKSQEKHKISPKKPEISPPKPPTFTKPVFSAKKFDKDNNNKPKSESDKEKKEYKSVLQKPVEIKPKNISHLINLPDKIATVDRHEIKEARKEYMTKAAEQEKTNEEERKALLSKLLGTRDWSDRPKPILKKPSKSFREIDESRREALARELSKSKENNVGVYSKDDVKDRISAAVERQKLEDKSKFQRTPLRATVGPIACSKYNEEMLRKREISKSQTLPSSFSFSSTSFEKETSKSTDDILGGRASTMPRSSGFTAVLVRSPSMTLHRTASSFFSDRKSYTNLLETDIDTGESVTKPLVMETDLDEVLRIRQATGPQKSRSMHDIYSQIGLKSVVKDVYDDTDKNAPKKWEKTQSLTALTSLSVAVFKDEEEDEVFKDAEDKTDSNAEPTWRKTTSDHEIRIAKSLTKLDLPDWYKKRPPKPAEEKVPKPSKVPQFHIGDTEIANRSRTSSMNSSFSHARPVVISTRVTMPRTSPTTPTDQDGYQLPSQRIKKKQEETNPYKPIRSAMESLDVILSKSREALVEKELKVAERKRVTAEFQSKKWEAPVIKKWEPPVIKSPAMKKRESPEVKEAEFDPEKQKAIDALADFMTAENSTVTESAPPVDPKFTSSVSISLNSAKPPPVPKTHNTSSESELSFLNRQQAHIHDTPDSHFKPVNTSSNSDHDSSVSSINPPNFDRALARSSPDLTRESPEPRRADFRSLQAAPEPSRPRFNLSAPPDEIESISDIENAVQPEPEPTLRVAMPTYHPAPRIQPVEQKPAVRPVKMQAAVRPMQEPVEPKVTAKVKPAPPLRTSSRKEAERPATLQQKPTASPPVRTSSRKEAERPTSLPPQPPASQPVRTSSRKEAERPTTLPKVSAMDRLKPQRPAPGRPEVSADVMITPEKAAQPQRPPTGAPAPIFTKPVAAIHFQPNTSRSPEGDTSFTQEKSPSYQAPPPVSPTKTSPPRVGRKPEKKESKAPKPVVSRKPEKSKSPESPKKAAPVVTKKPATKKAEMVIEPARQPMSMSHPVNTSIESQETPSFRLARAPASRNNSYRDAPGPASPRSPTGSYRDRPISPRSPTDQSALRPEVELRRHPQSPRTPQRPYTDVGHHPNWKPPAPEVLRRSYEGPKVHAPRAVIETDSDLSLYNSPETMSPVKKPMETDLDTIGVRRLPARAILETNIDGDLYDSPLRKKGHTVLETNIDDDIPSRNSSYKDRENSRNSSYSDNNSSHRRQPAPSLPPKRYTGYQAAPAVRDPANIPPVPPRWDSGITYPEKQRDYGPAPNVPPRQTPTKPQPIETDIDADISFRSDGSRGSYKAPDAQLTYNNRPNSQPPQNNARYYDNVPGSREPVTKQQQQRQPQPGYNQPRRGNAFQDNRQQKSNPEQPRSKRPQQVPLYYQNHQQGGFKAPPIPPREVSKDVPPPAIHKMDGTFETDMDFNLNSFETVAVEGDLNSNTPHGTLTRFGRNQKPPSSSVQPPKAQVRSGHGYNFDFEAPSNSMPPVPPTHNTTTYSTCAGDGPRHVFSSNQSRTSHTVPMETEEDMLFAYIVNKQRKEPKEDENATVLPKKAGEPGSLEFGPDSFKALGRHSALKVDTNSFRFSKEEEQFKCEVGFSGASEQEATLAEVLDGLLALPPSPQGSTPRQLSTDSLDETPDSSPDSENGFFGPISESGENLLSLNRRVQNIDENRVKVKCRNSKCGNEMVLVQARCSYKTCHNCYTYYCCRHCRRNDWTQHKATCSYSRIASMCKHVIKTINKDPDMLYSMSKIAKAGYLTSGRGCVLLVLQNLQEAEQFVRVGHPTLRLEPVYCSMTELEEYYVLGEYGDSVMDMCVDYSPYMNFIVCSAIVMGKETRTNSSQPRKREGPVIKKCAKLSLSASLSETETDSVTTVEGALILTLGNNSNSFLSPHEARDESFDNVQRKLRQRGVCLREQYPDVFNQLVAYVNENQAFAPITIYPYDGSTGNTFMCVIKLDQETTRKDPVCQITFDSFT